MRTHRAIKLTPCGQHRIITRAIKAIMRHLRTHEPSAMDTRRLSKITEYNAATAAPLIYYMTTSDHEPYYHALSLGGYVSAINAMLISLAPHYIHDPLPTLLEMVANPIMDQYTTAAEAITATHRATTHISYFEKHVARAEGRPTPGKVPTAAELDVIIATLGHGPSLAAVRRYLRAHMKTMTTEAVHILTLLTGLPQPHFTPTERQRIFSMFRLVLFQCQKIRPGRSISYRSILYRLTRECVADEQRRDDILANISLPRQKTLGRLDDEWVDIAADIPSITDTRPILQVADDLVYEYVADDAL